MAKVFLSLEISVKSASSKDNINKLNSNNIPFEEYEGEIYLINKNVFDSGVDLRSREYDKPYAKFCMRLADTADSSIYMGEGSLDEEVLAVLYEVFGDTLEFRLTLSCNSDWESISACIKFNEEEDKYYCDTEVTESSDEDDDEDDDEDEDEDEDELDEEDYNNDKIEKAIDVAFILFSHVLYTEASEIEGIKDLIANNICEISGIDRSKEKINDWWHEKQIWDKGYEKFNNNEGIDDIKDKTNTISKSLTRVELFKIINFIDEVNIINASESIKQLVLKREVYGIWIEKRLESEEINWENEIKEFKNYAELELKTVGEGCDYPLSSRLIDNYEIVFKGIESTDVVQQVVDLIDTPPLSLHRDSSDEDRLKDWKKKIKEYNIGQELYIEAKSAYDNNEYENAITNFNKYIDFKSILLTKEYILSISQYENKSIRSVISLLSQSYQEIGKFEESLKLYQAIIKFKDSKPSEDDLAHIGFLYFKLEQYQESIKEFNKVIKINPQNIYAITYLADCFVAINNNDQALSILNQGIEDNPTQPPNTTDRFWLFQQKAEIVFSQQSNAPDNWLDAIDIYKLAIEIREDGFCYSRLGMCYQDLENFKDALVSYEKAIELDENLNDAYVNYNIGECHRRSGRYSKSVEFYQSSIEFNNENVLPHAHQSLGISYLNLTEYRKSIESLKKAHQTKFTFQNLGKAFFGLEEYESAQEEFDKVVEEDAGYKWGYQERGKTHEKLGNDKLAIKDFDKVIELDSNYKWAYHEKGKVYLKLNEHALALECFEKVIEIDSEYKLVFYDFAISYQFMGMYEKAIDYYKSLISGNTAISWKENQNLLLHYNIIAAKNNTPPSLKSEEDLLKDSSDKFLLEALLERGKREHYDDEGAFYPEISLMDLNKVIEIDTKSHEAYFFRAKFYLNSSYSKFYSKEKGIEDLKSCLEIKRYTPALIRYAGLILDFDEKIKLIGEAIELSPDNAFAWQKYGEILYENKDFKGALEKFKKSDELDSDGFSLQRIAKTYAALKFNDQAIDFYNKAIELVDWYENWMCELSEVYVETKQIDKAESSILKALNHHPIEKYYRQLYKILCLKYPSDDYESVLSDISNFLDSCYFGWDNDSEKPSDLEYLKTYEEKLIFENKSIFSFFKFLKGETINHFIENGGYVTKVHILNNHSLNISLDHINKIISNSDYTVLETAISHQLVSSEMLDEIIDTNDNSYLYSYKLLGVCSNPNVTEKQIEKLKSNKYNWVKQKAYSVTKEFNGIDKSDRYVLLGLLNNPNLKSTDHNYQKLLESTSPYNFTYKLDGGRVGIEEYSVGYIPEEDVYEGFLEVAPQDENWSDYVANDWYNYGDSEYGVTDYVGEIDVWSDDESSIAIPSFVSQVQSWPKNEGEISASVGEFVQRVTSGEKGEWEYHEFEMENEFRPENLHPKYTDSERAIEGYEYQLGEGDWIDIEGELSESRGSYVDIELMLGTESGLVDIYFEDIKNEMEDQDLNPEDEADVKSYFQKLIKQ